MDDCHDLGSATARWSVHVVEDFVCTCANWLTLSICWNFGSMQNIWEKFLERSAPLSQPHLFDINYKFIFLGLVSTLSLVRFRPELKAWSHACLWQTCTCNKAVLWQKFSAAPNLIKGIIFTSSGTLSFYHVAEADVYAVILCTVYVIIVYQISYLLHTELDASR